MPERLTRPTVGLMPTSPLTDDGQTIEPSVSVPTPIAARLAAIAAPVPELEPHGLRSSAYGFLVCPPRPLHPLDDFVERKFAHSLRFVLPRITAPAARSRSTTNASRARDRPFERERAGRRHHPIGGVDVVLDEHRNAVQRPARAAWPCVRRRARSAIAARLGIDLDDRAQRRTRAIDLFDPLEIEIDELPRRVAARLHPLLQLRDASPRRARTPADWRLWHDGVADRTARTAMHTAQSASPDCACRRA